MGENARSSPLMLYLVPSAGLRPGMFDLLLIIRNVVPIVPAAGISRLQDMVILLASAFRFSFAGSCANEGDIVTFPIVPRNKTFDLGQRLYLSSQPPCFAQIIEVESVLAAVIAPDVTLST